MGNFQPPVVVYFNAGIKVLEAQKNGFIKLNKEEEDIIKEIIKACTNKFVEKKDTILQQIEEDED